MLNVIKAYSKRIFTSFAKYVVLKHVNHSQFEKKCLLIYITKPFVKYTKASHPNYYEAKAIVSVLNNLGYDIDVVFFSNEKFNKFEKYDLIIGLGDCFDNSIIKCKNNAVRIYYATGANFIDSFENEVKRWIDLYDKKGTVISPSRFGMPKNLQLAIQSMKRVDGIITVGGEWCASTYSMWGKKIYQVGVIPFMHYSNMDMNRDISECKNNFLWLGGKGLVHKGLDIVLETFSRLPDHNLYIACNYEKGFFEKYINELNMENIHYMGFINTSSEKFFELSNRCAYTIGASCSEGTCTSIVTCMYTGLIPVTSKESDIDYGYKIEECSSKAIIEMIHKLDEMTDKEVEEKMKESYQFVNNNYSVEAFQEKFNNALINILEDCQNA